ncbi:MAG TPA: NADH-quinone oxidoreductase subunit M, partial [Reyranella sp.]
MIFSDHMLTVITFLPLLGAFLLLFVPGNDAGKNISRWIALIVSSVTFILTLIMWAGFDNANPGFQFVENYEWIGSSIGYRMGVDGISVLFVVLTGLLLPVCVIASWGSIQKRVREYMLVFLVLETMCLGVFTTLDLAMFYVFFEGSLIPMFLIIGIWGGARRIQAAYKFFFYSFTGTVLMLIAIMAMYWQAGTLDIQKLLAFHFDPRIQTWLWLGFFASFAVKMPMWPFHRWLPEAHVEAPTAGSVILAAILLKLGGYGFIRFSLSMFPDASVQFAPFVFTL